MTALVHLHSDKETMYDIGEKLGLKGEALDFFKYACCEVKIELAVNAKTGEASITKVDDRELLPKGIKTK